MTKEADKKRNQLRPVPKLTVSFTKCKTIRKPSLHKKDSTKSSHSYAMSQISELRKSRSNLSSVSSVNGLNVNPSLLSFKNLEHLSSQNSLNKLKIKPYYMPVSREIDRGSTKEVNANNIKNVLILISFSFAFLNLPYLITWLVFIYQIWLHKNEFSINTYLYVALEVAEVFHILNYSVLFFFYCSPGSVFRKKLLLLGIFLSLNNIILIFISTKFFLF